MGGHDRSTVTFAGVGPCEVEVVLVSPPLAPLDRDLYGTRSGVVDPDRHSRRTFRCCRRRPNAWTESGLGALRESPRCPRGMVPAPLSHGTRCAKLHPRGCSPRAMPADKGSGHLHPNIVRRVIRNRLSATHPSATGERVVRHDAHRRRCHVRHQRLRREGPEVVASPAGAVRLSLVSHAHNALDDARGATHVVGARAGPAGYLSLALRRRTPVIGPHVLDRGGRAVRPVCPELEGVPAVGANSAARPDERREVRARWRSEDEERSCAPLYTAGSHDVRGHQSAKAGPLGIAGTPPQHPAGGEVLEGLSRVVDAVGLARVDGELVGRDGGWAADQRPHQAGDQHPRGPTARRTSASPLAFCSETHLFRGSRRGADFAPSPPRRPVTRAGGATLFGVRANGGRFTRKERESSIRSWNFYESNLCKAH